MLLVLFKFYVSAGSVPFKAGPYPRPCFAGLNSSPINLKIPRQVSRMRWTLCACFCGTVMTGATAITLR
jgi:hypothetical protein